MTASIYDVLARLPTGEPGVTLDDAALGKYLRATVGTDAEKQRNARHTLRDVLYRDGGDEHMATVIADVFEAREVIAKRQRMIPYAKFSNCLKRIVGEMSTVYAEPAKRTVGGTPENELAYRHLVESMSLDEQLGVVNEMLNLHRALLVGPRIRENADGSREMVLDIATPSTVRAVTLPYDKTSVVAWLIQVDMQLVHNPWAGKPAWALWTDHEMMFLDAQFQPIGGTHVEHGLGMSRWIPISYSAVAVPGFWPGCEGEDLVSARVAEWLTAVLMIKETKSNTKQPIVSGDTTTMARSQAADSELPIEAPEGVAVSTIDMGTDPDTFVTASDHILERAGNNYGLSLAALKHQGVQSAEAREIMLAPIRERRGKQIKIFRRFERRLAVVMSAVAARWGTPEMRFEIESWCVDFADIRVASSKMERLAIYEKERAAGLTSTPKFMVSENPDLDIEAATEEMLDNIEAEVGRNVAMRPLVAIAGGMGGAPTTGPVVGSLSASTDTAHVGDPANHDTAATAA